MDGQAEQRTSNPKGNENKVGKRVMTNYERIKATGNGYMKECEECEIAKLCDATTDDECWCNWCDYLKNTEAAHEVN